MSEGGALCVDRKEHLTDTGVSFSVFTFQSVREEEEDREEREREREKHGPPSPECVALPSSSPLLASFDLPSEPSTSLCAQYPPLVFSSGCFLDSSCRHCRGVVP